MQTNVPTAQWSFFAGVPQVLPTHDSEREREAWQSLIDSSLKVWLEDPHQLEDDGVEPPSKETIVRAIQLARESQQRGLPAPSSVVPDPNGGIVFERREAAFSEVLHLWDDGTAEYQRFEGTRLMSRLPYELA